MIEIVVEVQDAVTEVTRLPEGVRVTVIDHDAVEDGQPLAATYERIGGRIVSTEVEKVAMGL